MADEFNLGITLLTPDTDSVTKAIDDVVNKFSEADNSISGVDSAILGLNPKLLSAGIAFAALAAASAATFKIVRDGVNDFKDLEESLIAIGRISGRMNR